MLRNLRVAFFLTARSFTRGNKAIIAAPIILMALIYINVLFIPSLIHGALYQIDNNVITKLSSDLVVIASGNQTDMQISESKLKKISQLKDVAGVTGTYQTLARISNEKHSATWQLVAIDPVTYSSVFQNTIIGGTRLIEGDKIGIMLGASIAGNGLESDAIYKRSLHGVEVGEKISVNLPNSEGSSYYVRGLIDDDFMLSNQRAFVTRDALQTLLPMTTNKFTSIHIKLRNTASSNVVIEEVNKLLPNTNIQTSADYAIEVREQAKTSKKINTILSGFSFVVAAIIIFIVTYIDLVNRRKQIGIERAIGISNASIVMTYLMRAFLCTIIGITIGSIIYLFVMLPYSKSHPFSFPGGPVSLLNQSETMLRYAAGLTIIAVVGAIVPAFRAVKVSIIDAIRS